MQQEKLAEAVKTKLLLWIRTSIKLQFCNLRGHYQDSPRIFNCHVQTARIIHECCPFNATSQSVWFQLMNLVRSQGSVCGSVIDGGNVWKKTEVFWLLPRLIRGQKRSWNILNLIDLCRSSLLWRPQVWSVQYLSNNNWQMLVYYASACGIIRLFVS